MKKEIENINGIDYTVIIAEEGFEFIRIEDELNFGDKIYLGKGDSEDNYKEIEINKEVETLTDNEE